MNIRYKGEGTNYSYGVYLTLISDQSAMSDVGIIRGDKWV